MKSINQMVLLTVIMGLVVGLIYDPISVKPIFAAPPDPCIAHPFPWGCQDRKCENSPLSNTISCCWRDNTNGGRNVCQVCDIDDNGDIGDCGDVTPTSKGIPDSSVIAPPPSGVAPPPSTEKCPDNSAVDSKGNCTPTTQSPNDGDNKPKFPSGDILGDLQTNQGIQPPS